jgi:hypothetical protein
MSVKDESGVCSNGDFLSNFLGRLGVNRSLLWTLTLLPFAWGGVVWAADAVRDIWTTVSSSVGG